MREWDFEIPYPTATVTFSVHAPDEAKARGEAQWWMPRLFTGRTDNEPRLVGSRVLQ